MAEVDPITLILAIYGAGLSTFLAIWKIVRYLLEGIPRLKITVSPGALTYTASISPLGLILDMANIGKRPVTISSAGFRLKNGADLIFMADTDRLPKRLEEGENHIIYRSLDDLRPDLKLASPEYAWVKDQTGKEYKSENIDKYPIIKGLSE